MWLLRGRFLALLVALLGILLLHPLLSTAWPVRVLYDLLLTVVFLTAFQVIFTQRTHRLLALVLVIPTVVGLWTGYVLPGLPRRPLIVSFHILATVFLGFTVAMILRVIYSDRKVTADSIYGAFTGYLLVALAFGHLYCLAESVSPGSFRGSAEFMTLLKNPDAIHSLLTYFSVITLTTVGYGDISPGNPAVRSLAALEAILGQFYIVVLMAELIGKRASQGFAGERTHTNDDRADHSHREQQAARNAK